MCLSRLDPAAFDENAVVVDMRRVAEYVIYEAAPVIKPAFR